jgi:LmbE family N-acetylglucosaminyl deacetylase
MLRPKRLVVVAPHPDDDAIGCGGTLARSVANGAHVLVVYVTDGAASHPNSKRFPPAALGALREREAIASLKLLGITTPPVFFRVPDGSVASQSGRERDRVVTALESLVSSGQCDMVFGPWRLEPHPDHAGTAALLAEALGRGRSAPPSLSYTVWLDVFGAPAQRPSSGHPRVSVRLSAREVARKRAAIMAHASQVSSLIDDDPHGFRVAPEVLDLWAAPVERFFVDTLTEAERVSNALHVGTSIR